MKTFRKLWPFLRPQRHRLILVMVFAILSVFFKMAVPFLTGLAIDELRQGHFDISLLLILMGGCIVFGSLFRYLFDLLLSYAAEAAVKQMRDDLFHAINDAPISYLDRHAHGDLLLRLVSDTERVRNGLITGAGALFEGIVQVLVTVGFMFAIHWLLAITVIALTPLSIFVSRAISSRNARYFRKQNEDLGVLSTQALETLNTIESIQSYGLWQSRDEEFAQNNKQYRSSSFKAMFAASWINPCTRLVNNTIYGAVIVLGACILLFPGSFAFAGASFSVGMLSSFLTYSNQYMTPFNEIADASSEVLYATTALNRIDETIREKKDIDEGTTPLGEQIQTLEAKGLVFSYDGKKNIIDGFDLEIYRGHKIALVGTTGCGKTTLINLLMRFYDPQQGAFYMNGVSTIDAKKGEMRSHVGMVLQDTWLMHGTVAENIAYGKPNATKEEIVLAATKAHADGFIRLLPQGYDTMVSSSSGLSMGEKQLLCVARIILMQPEIVLLDEATSNIDLRTELQLSDAFDELMKGKTSLVVAHRLSTIRNADHILVMDKGKIIEQGNFAQLMEKNGFFAELYRAQLS